MDLIWFTDIGPICHSMEMFQGNCARFGIEKERQQAMMPGHG
jgi:hypothetical protein